MFSQRKTDKSILASYCCIRYGKQYIGTSGAKLPDDCVAGRKHIPSRGLEIRVTYVLLLSMGWRTSMYVCTYVLQSMSIIAALRLKFVCILFILIILLLYIPVLQLYEAACQCDSRSKSKSKTLTFFHTYLVPVSFLVPRYYEMLLLLLQSRYFLVPPR